MLQGAQLRFRDNHCVCTHLPPVSLLVVNSDNTMQSFLIQKPSKQPTQRDIRLALGIDGDKFKKWKASMEPVKTD